MRFELRLELSLELRLELSLSEIVLEQTQIYRTLSCFELDRSKLELFRTQVHPPKPNFEPFRTPAKCPNFELVWPDTHGDK